MTIVALSFVANMANQVEYSTLFVGLSDEEAGNVITALEEQGVDVQSAPNGTLLVPKNQAEELRYTLYAQGLPSTETLDYGLYSDNATSFGATDQDKAFYEQAALQQNIAAMINGMEKISHSTVLLSLADTSAFVLSDSANTTSSATVMVELQPGISELSDADTEAIRAIVLGAVPMIGNENIMIVDQYMRNYGYSDASGDGLTSGTTAVEMQIELQKKVAEQLNLQISNLLSPVFGATNFESSVNVILDFDEKSTNSLTLTPPTTDAENMGIITSMKQTVERLQGTDTVPEGAVGADPNGASPTYPEIDEEAGDSTYYNVINEVNAEVNEVNQQIIEAQGDISELTASVVINGGTDVEAMLPDIVSLVSTAIGVPEESVQVRAMTFVEDTTVQDMIDQQTQYLEDQQRTAFMGEVIVPLIILGVIIAMLLIILNSIKRKKQKEIEAIRVREEAERRQELYEQQMASGNIVDIEAGDDTIESLLGETKNETMIQVKDFVDKDPQMVAQLLKNWLNDDFGG